MFTIAACLGIAATFITGATLALIANDLDEDRVPQSRTEGPVFNDPVPALVEWEWDASDYEFFLGQSQDTTAEMVTTPEPAPEAMAHLQEVIEETFEAEVFAEVRANTYEAFPRSMHTMTTMPPVSDSLKAKAIKVDDLKPFRIQTKPPVPMLPNDMLPMPMDPNYLHMVRTGGSIASLNPAERTAAY